MGCEAKIRLAIKRIDNDFVLHISFAQLQHSNHPVNAEIFSVYPENRTRKVEKDDIIIAMVMASVPSGDLISFIKKRYGVCLLQRDVHNLRRKILSTPESEDEMKKGLESLRNDIGQEGGQCWLSFDDDCNLKHFIFQTQQMRQDFKRFPGILILDVIQGVNSNSYPLCNVLSVDSNGKGQPVLHAVMSHESRSSISTCLRVLKKYCPEGPCIIFVDKEFEETSLIKRFFPEIKVMVAAFHGVSLVTNALQKCHISTPTQHMVLELFKEQIDTTSPQRYNELVQEISSLIPESAKAHFDDRWWNCPEMWASHAIGSMLKLHRTAVLNIDEYVLKIKSGKSRLCSVTPLCKCIRTLIPNNREISYSCELNSQSPLSSIHLSDPDLVNQITNDLTSFAAGLVIEQLQIREKTTYDVFIVDDTPDYVIIDNIIPEKQHIVNDDQCSCDFFHSSSLPCHHMFALRVYLQLPLYKETPSRFSQSSLETHEKYVESELDEMELDDKDDIPYPYHSDELHHDIAELPPPHSPELEDFSTSNTTTFTTATTLSTTIAATTTAPTTITSTTVSGVDTHRRENLINSLTSQIADDLSIVDDCKLKRYLHQLKKFSKLVREKKALLIVDLSEADSDEPLSPSATPSTATSLSDADATATDAISKSQAASLLSQPIGTNAVLSTPVSPTPNSVAPDEKPAVVSDSNPSSSVTTFSETDPPSMSIPLHFHATPYKPVSNTTTTNGTSTNSTTSTSNSESVSLEQKDTKPVKYLGRVRESIGGNQNSTALTSQVATIVAFPKPNTKASGNKRHAAERANTTGNVQSKKVKRRC